MKQGIKKAIESLEMEVGVIGVNEIRDGLFQVSFSNDVSSPTKYYEWENEKMVRVYL